MRTVRLIMTGVSCSISLWLALMFAPAAPAQSGSVGFHISPSEFRAGQSASALLSITSTSITALTISAGDTFTFVFDSSVGTVSSIMGPVLVNSASLAAGDFSASFGATQVVVTYNGQPKPFLFGSTLGVEVRFTASGQVGTGKLSFSSRFTGSVNGNLPYTPVSIVDFANGGVTAVSHDGTLSGDGTPGAPLGVVAGTVAIAHDATLLGNGTNGAPLGVVAGTVAIAHDATLMGDGKTATPLGVVPGSVPIAHDGTLTGNGTTATPLGVVAGSVAITHDGTLTGSGTSGTPLGITVPLSLMGSSPDTPQHGGQPILRVLNVKTGAQMDAGGESDSFGPGIQVTGGSSIPDGSGTSSGFSGIVAMGGIGTGKSAFAGTAITAFAGGVQNGANTEVVANLVGNVDVQGNLSKGGGSFKIDHPLDPANKYLYHSFVESPDMMNIYNGNANLDSNGEAVVELPAWFSALNKDFRYLLTPIGAPGPGLYIGEEIADNRFKISGGLPGMRVSWQVTGIRQDAWANAHRIPVEEVKADRERGHYLYPELFDQPEEKSIQWARHPELMQRMKDRREQQIKQAQAAGSTDAAKAKAAGRIGAAGGQSGNSQASAKSAGR